MITSDDMKELAALVGLMEEYRVEFDIDASQMISLPKPSMQEVLLRKMRDEFAHALAERADPKGAFTIRREEISAYMRTRFTGDVVVMRKEDHQKLNDLLMKLMRLADIPDLPKIA